MQGSINQYGSGYWNAGSEGTTSGAVSRDVAEVVDWVMPDLKRILMCNENYIEFAGDGTDAGDAQAKINTTVVNKVIRGQDDIDTEIDAWIKNGLLMKNGILQVYPVDPMPEIEEYEDLSQDAIAQIVGQQAENYAVEDMEDHKKAERTSDLVSYPDGYKYSGKFKIIKPRRLIIEAVPNEDFIISDDVDCLSQADGLGPAYVSRLFRGRTVSELIALFPEKEFEIKQAAVENANDGDTDLSDASQIRYARGDVYDDYNNDDESNLMIRKVDLHEEWYRYDMDEDGIPELLHIIRINKKIIDHEKTRDNSFVSWCPHPLPHRFYGESLADKIMMLQDMKTGILRAFMDSVSFAARPRIVYDAMAAQIDPTIQTQADIHDWAAGSTIRVAGNPGEMIMPLSVGGDAARNSMDGMNYLDILKTSWTGINPSHQTHPTCLLYTSPSPRDS